MVISNNNRTFAAAKAQKTREFWEGSFLRNDFFAQSEGSFLRNDLPHARPLMPASWPSLNRKVGRVIDRAGLEIRYTPFGYRGFESLTFRQKPEREPPRFSFFCVMETMLRPTKMDHILLNFRKLSKELSECDTRINEKVVVHS